MGLICYMRYKKKHDTLSRKVLSYNGYLHMNGKLIFVKFAFVLLIKKLYNPVHYPKCYKCSKQ